MRVSGFGTRTDNILRDAAELRERAISKAAQEKNLLGVDTLTRQDINEMSHADLQRYFKTDAQGFTVEHAASEVKVAKHASKLLVRALAAGSAGTAMLAAGASSGSMGLMVAGGLTLAATVGGSLLSLVASGIGNLTPNMFSSSAHLKNAEKLAQEAKEEISAQRFGSNPEAAGLREQDAQARADLLNRAREVDPQATPKNLFDQQHTWLLAQ